MESSSGFQVQPRIQLREPTHRYRLWEGVFLVQPQWVKFARSHIARWRKGFEWVLSTPPGHKLLVVTFEELKENRISVVDRMLDFLHYKITSKLASGRLM